MEILKTYYMGKRKTSNIEQSENSWDKITPEMMKTDRILDDNLLKDVFNNIRNLSSGTYKDSKSAISNPRMHKQNSNNKNTGKFR